MGVLFFVDEVLQGLHVQLHHDDFEKIMAILRRSQSVYMKQLQELSNECDHEMEEAKSNIEYLQLIVRPCKALESSGSPADVAIQLPQIFHLFRFIWLNSKYYNTMEYIWFFYIIIRNIYIHKMF